MNNERKATMNEMLVGAETVDFDGFLPDCSNVLRRLEGEELERAKTPRVGAPVTFQHYSDRDGGTIVRVAKNFIEIRKDEAVRTDNNGMSESQSYRFRIGKTVVRAYKRKDGRYYEHTSYVSIGCRAAYHDYSF